MHGCGSHRQHRRPARRESLVAADDLRASDAERERVVAHLREQAGEGRLTVEELDTRIGAAYAATSRRELAALTADLPAPRRPSQSAARAGQDFRAHLRTYAMVMALLVAIWALTGAAYFWPVWPALGWGIGVASHWSATRRVTARRGRGRGGARVQLGAPRG